MAQLDPDLPAGEAKTVGQVIDEATGQPRFRSFLLSSFALLLAMAATTCYVPARRAMRVDPMTALRRE